MILYQTLPLNGEKKAKESKKKLYPPTSVARSFCEAKVARRVTAPCGWLRPIGKQPSLATARPSASVGRRLVFFILLSTK